MTEYDLKNEVGKCAWDLLTLDEQTAILAGSGNSLSLAGMRVFELLWKQFKPTYRLGKLYKADSDRYREYYKIYCQYAQKLGAGRINKSVRTKPKVDQWRNLL